MKRADVYREAARQIENGQARWQWSCWAIDEVAGSNIDQSLEAAQYAAVFYPGDAELGKRDDRWGLRWRDLESNPSETWQTLIDCRVLALCFMAAMVDAGDA